MTDMIEQIIAAVAKKAANKAVVNIAIDGRCASGKSTLAQVLHERLGGNLIHMDDFFLPSYMRTAERLSKAGGNVHYERFEEEVLKGLASGTVFEYGVYDCSTDAVERRIEVQPAAVNIVEGTYSTTPRFGSPYDITVFVTTDAATQERRIRERNGDAGWQMFRDRWIPLEERYFEQCKEVQCADFTINT